MASPENFVEYLPWVVASVVVIVCVIGWLIANRDLDNRN